MSLKGGIISLFVTAVIMAITWSLMDLPQLSGFTGDFLGKILVSLVILVISKIVSRLLGG